MGEVMPRSTICLPICFLLPDNHDGRCVGMAVGPNDFGEWDDQTCDSRYQAICQRPQDNVVFPDPPPTPSPEWTCPSGWSGFGSYCYQVKFDHLCQRRSEAVSVYFFNVLCLYSIYISWAWGNFSVTYIICILLQICVCGQLVPCLNCLYFVTNGESE